MVVMTAKQYKETLFHILDDLITVYNNKYPYNLGYHMGNDTWSWDCWCLNPKTIVWGWNDQIPVGDYQRPNLSTGLGDWTGRMIMDHCYDVSGDFSKVADCELLLSSDNTHAGAFVGEFERNGFVFNTIECTNILNGDSRTGVVATFTDASGNRYSYKGGVKQNKKWGQHGKLPYLEYDGKKDVLVVDGSWGKNTTIWTQTILGTPVDGEISNQPLSNKIFLPNAVSIGSDKEFGTWQFKVFGWSAGSEMVRALQRLIGANPDGWFGRASVKALQIFLRDRGFYTDAIDGSMGYNTVCAWQRYVNSVA